MREKWEKEGEEGELVGESEDEEAGERIGQIKGKDIALNSATVSFLMQ